MDLAPDESSNVSESLLRTIKRAIKETFWDSAETSDAGAAYEPLFRIISEFLERCPVNAPVLPVFTTNYDLVLERAIEKSHISGQESGIAIMRTNQILFGRQTDFKVYAVNNRPKSSIELIGQFANLFESPPNIF